MRDYETDALKFGQAKAKEAFRNAKDGTLRVQRSCPEVNTGLQRVAEAAFQKHWETLMEAYSLACQDHVQGVSNDK